MHYFCGTRQQQRLLVGRNRIAHVRHAGILFSVVFVALFSESNKLTCCFTTLSTKDCNQCTLLIGCLLFYLTCLLYHETTITCFT